MRVIARLDVKNNYVIKGIQLEGLRKIGDPLELAKRYSEQGADEIIFMDAVASLYGRNNLFHIINKACEEVFIPITIGGGIRSLNDIEQALKSGADKIALNTAAIKNPDFIKEASRIYGSQCIVGSIEAKAKGGHWEAYVDNGREETGLNVLEWAKKLEDLGVGEIMITSIDRDGTKKGFDKPLVNAINSLVHVPVIASGGAGKSEDLIGLNELCHGDLSAAAFATVLHYDLETILTLKKGLDQ